MAPTRKSRSVNKRFANTMEASPSKDEETSNKSRQRKKKLTDMLGPQWSKEELQRFYEAYRKFGKDWKKVAASVHNRTVEMTESLYTMNRAYLSLPEGTASVVGLIAMMTDHYSVMDGSDSEQESNDGIGVVQKPQKRSKAKVRSNTTRETNGLGDTSQFQIVAPDYGCLSLLKKKRSGGGQVRAVGKRTPRFPIRYNYDRDTKEKYASPSRHGQKIKIDVKDDDVAHEVALVLAEASYRGGSPQRSYTPNKRKEGSESDMTSGKNAGNEKVEDGVEASLGSSEAYIESFRGRSHYPKKKQENVLSTPPKGKKVSGKKRDAGFRDTGYRTYTSDDVKEASSGTEGRQVSGMKRKFAAEAPCSTSFHSGGSKKKTKKFFCGRDDYSALDALQTLADVSLMSETGVELEDAPFNEEKASAVDNPGRRDIVRDSQLPVKSKPLSRKKGCQSPTRGLKSKSERGSPLDANSVPETGVRKRKQKSPASKISSSETQAETKTIEIKKEESSDPGKKPAGKSKRNSQSQIGPPGKISEHSSSTDVRKEGDDLSVSSFHAPASDQINLPTKLKNRRKADKTQIQRNSSDIHLPNSSNVKSKAFRALQHDKELSLRLEKFYNCLSNHHIRRWCNYEWFYSAIDYPWFSKSEFVEYLYHVGLGHVPRLTRVEWGVIRSSLGKPRRFSDQFLKEEKEKLYHYRESVRSHYTELRSGTRDGLPTDLARPLAVGQHVVAIHPRTREIHNGSVLTVDHDRCRVQFDHPELGVEFVMDIDCMPLFLSQNLPASLNRQSSVTETYFESSKPQMDTFREDGRKEYVESAANTKMENGDGISHVSTYYPTNNLLKQRRKGFTGPNSEIKNSHGEMLGPEQVSVSQPSITVHMQAKEADIRALAELTRALDRKNALVAELKRMNDDVSKDNSLRSIDSFKKQYAAVLVQLDEVFDQVSSALLSLRQRNTYPGYFLLESHKDKERDILPAECEISDAEESAPHVSEIVETSKNKARKMVDAAMQAISSLKDESSSVEKIEEAIDYVNHRLSADDSSNKPGPGPANRVNGSLASNFQPRPSGLNLVADNSSDTKPNDAVGSDEFEVPAELVSNCVATLLMIQKCTERQFPPSDVAQVLDLAVTGLQPCSSQNLPLYEEIQNCMGIIRNQIMALVPT